MRVDADDADWLVTRTDEEEAVDEIFADLFDENATTASGTLPSGS